MRRNRFGLFDHRQVFQLKLDVVFEYTRARKFYRAEPAIGAVLHLLAQYGEHQIPKASTTGLGGVHGSVQSDLESFDGDLVESKRSKRTGLDSLSIPARNQLG